MPHGNGGFTPAPRTNGTFAPTPRTNGTFAPAPRANGGFTLIELIVTISISLIILGVTLTILISSMNISSRSIQTSQSEQIVSACLDLILERVGFSGGLTPSTDLGKAIAGSEDFLYIGNPSAQPSNRGRLYLRTQEMGGANAAAQDVYGEQFYLGGSISMRIIYTRTLSQRPAATVTVTMYDTRGSALAHKTRSTVLVNALLDAPLPNGSWDPTWTSPHSTEFPADALVVMSRP
jgi:prepilin-type N-terminal cleavage/methylation domain-containing protein